jgi:hypothetical protein
MKILRNEITETQTSFGGNVSSILSFHFPERPPWLLDHIFSLLPTCTSTIITLEPGVHALNAEFQHFIPD